MTRGSIYCFSENLTVLVLDCEKLDLFHWCLVWILLRHGQLCQLLQRWRPKYAFWPVINIILLPGRMQNFHFVWTLPINLTFVKFFPGGCEHGRGRWVSMLFVIDVATRLSRIGCLLLFYWHNFFILINRFIELVRKVFYHHRWWCDHIETLVFSFNLQKGQGVAPFLQQITCIFVLSVWVFIRLR